MSFKQAAAAPDIYSSYLTPTPINIIIKMAGSININITSSTLTVLVMAVTLYQSLFIDAFTHHQHTTSLKTKYLASSKDDNIITDIDIPLDATTTTISSSTPSNPFLPLLSKGLHQTSIAMNKDTSNQFFSTSSSLQRLRKQVITNTKVGPSSLGEHAGLGLFATKNIKAGTIVGLYPAHALGYELFVPIDNNDDVAMNNEDNLQDLSMFMSGNEQDEKYFAEHPHGNSPYLHATDQPLFQRSSLLSPLFNEDSNVEMSPPLYLDVNPTRNDELDPIWTSHYINDGASLLDTIQHKDSSIEEGIEEYYRQSTSKKNCIHIPFGPSPLLATITTKKVKKGQELFTSYGVVYWLGSVDMDDDTASSTTSMTETIQNQILQSARDLQAAMEVAKYGYSNESSDLIIAFDDL